MMCVVVINQDRKVQVAPTTDHRRWTPHIVTIYRQEALDANLYRVVVVILPEACIFFMNNDDCNGAGTDVAVPTATAIDTAMNTTTVTTPSLQQQQQPKYLTPPTTNVVQNNETVLLQFVDGRQLFAFCSVTDKRKSTVRIQKRNYPTSHCVGLPYGSILELQHQAPNSTNSSTQLQLVPLPVTEKLIPDLILPSTISTTTTTTSEDGKVDSEPFQSHGTESTNTGTATITKDNRHLVDTNTAQAIDYPELLRMRLQGCHGNEIVTTLLENSKTYDTKTTFAQEKYILRKQIKHQVRCRIIQCNAATVMEALHRKDSKKYMNIREDTLGQILSYSNICGGCQTLVYDDNYGAVLSAICERMNGYGCIYAIYEAQQPSYTEMFQKFNLSFAQVNCIQYVHTGDLFYDTNHPTTSSTTSAASTTSTTNEIDHERIDRERLQWPCVLQDHTRRYMETQSSEPTYIRNFLIKRASRFARKLCRTTNIEAKQSLCGEQPLPEKDSPPDSTTTKTARLCDSLVLVTKYDPTTTLLQLFPHLAPSSPYVIYCEFLEPLAECFKQIQTDPALLSINLRLSDTWMREYQILPNRTHPAMSMSQSGGFILTGIKLHPVFGSNEFNEEQLKEIRDEIGGRRARLGRGKKSTTTTTGTANCATPMDTDTTSGTSSKKRKKPT